MKTNENRRDEMELRNADRTPSIRWALTSLSLSMLMASLDSSIANIGLPTLAEAFNASFQAAQWVLIAYLLTVTSLVVGMGRLGDIVGRRRLFFGGISLFTMASMLCGMAFSLWILVAARAAQGLGAAIMMALSIASVSEMVPKEKTGSTLGLLGTMSALGTTVGPSLGGLLIEGFGWRAIFLVNIPIGIINLILAHRYLPVDRVTSEATRDGFDIAGMLVLAFTLASYALAITIGKGDFGSVNIILLLAAALGAALFLRTESRAASPLIRLTMFRNPVLSTGLTMSMLVSTVMMSTLVVGPFYLSLALGLDAAVVGGFLSVGPLVAALSGIPAGRIVDRFGAACTTGIGLLGIAAGCFILAIIPETFGVAGYVTPILCITASYALFQTANNTAVMTDVRSEQRGAISGMLNLSRNLGLITGASVMGAIFTIGSATNDIMKAHPEAIARGMRITFCVSGGLIAFAIILATAGRAYVRRTIG